VCVCMCYNYLLLLLILLLLLLFISYGIKLIGLLINILLEVHSYFHNKFRYRLHRVDRH